MAAPQTLHPLSLPFENPISEPLGSWSSPLFVLNQDFTLATGGAAADALDIYGLFNGDLTNGAKVQPISHPGAWTHLEVGLALYRPNGTETITAAPTLLAFGRIPARTRPGVYPSNVNSSIPNPPSITGPRESMWVPLGTEARVSGTLDLTPPTGVAAEIARTGSADLCLTDFLSLPLLGALEVIITVKTAGTVSGSAAGLVVGRFTSP